MYNVIINSVERVRNMKRNVLLLINGFGIEQAGSYNIYTSSLMPNLDRYTKEGLFTSMECMELDYKSGYRNFSIGINKPLTYSIVENSISKLDYKNNNIFKHMLDTRNASGGKIHIFCFWENDKTIEHLFMFIKEMMINPDVQIVVHLILCQKSLYDYKNMSAVMTKLNYEYSNNLRISIVSGENNFNKTLTSRDIIKSLITDYGEKWKDTSKKISVLTQNRTAPCDARTFMLNEGFALEENDIIFFYNYNNIDIGHFRKDLGAQKYKTFNVDNLKIYSLFPVKCDVQIPFMYNFALSSTYFANFIKEIGAKALVLDTKERCGYINYYLTGLRNNADVNVNYIPTDDNFIYDKDKIMALFTKYNHEFIILNYEIESCKSVEEMKERLKSIDEIIGVLGEYLVSNNGALFISSFYGIETELYNDRHELCKINFSTRVPLIVLDKSKSKRNDAILEGGLFDLAHTIYANINPNYKANKGLIRKKPNFLSIFYKKSK